MHPWRPWIVLAALAAFAGHAAVVYKWKDADGVIHYSDQSVPGAEKITTSTSLANGGAAGARANADAQSTNAPKPAAAPGLGYTILSLSSPAPEQTFFGDEIIGVALALEPGLQADHSVTWRLNGKPIDEAGPTTTQFALPHLDRGTYAIAATVTDQRSGESQSTGAVTFYVRQPSALSPQHKSP